MKSSVRIAILYSELADYSLACFKALKKRGAEILLVHWPVNPEAPFRFDLSFCKKTATRDRVDAAQLASMLERFAPDLVLCSGWMDKGYVSVCRKWRTRIPVVLTLDNHWRGSFRQQVAVALSPFTIRRAFSHAFVPGEVQKRYALRLGFPESHIQTGFYCADLPKFNAIYHELHPEKKREFPKRFLYLGRYVQHKGIFDLWNAFLTVREEFPEWELWCCGTGEAFEERVEAEGIRHFGFVQPSGMQPVLAGAGVYVLPSHFEPWGVAVQEMAASGFPLILSSEVGAGEAFLRVGHNGFEYPSGEVEQLAHTMKKMARAGSEVLVHMAEFSHAIAQKITPEQWADKVRSFL